MDIEMKVQNILDRNFTRGNNANAKKELLDLFGVSECNKVDVKCRIKKCFLYFVINCKNYEMDKKNVGVNFL